jgi:Ca2+-binding RTX toxin-like protein
MGVDQLYGGDGDDIVRGGQDNDSLMGDSGDDWMSGDRGADTISGGSGADTFQTFVGAGIDRILDFDAAEGDRIIFETPGVAYTTRQEGADTVVDLGGGDQVILVGVTLSTLPAGWI